MTLAGSLAALQTVAGACSGVKSAPVYPPENTSVFPFSAAYPERGILTGEAAGQARHLHTVIVEIHAAPRTILSKAVESAVPLVEEFNRRLVADPKLGGACDTIVWPIPYEFGVLAWGTTETIGTRFHVTLKIREATT